MGGGQGSGVVGGEGVVVDVNDAAGGGEVVSVDRVRRVLASTTLVTAPGATASPSPSSSLRIVRRDAHCPIRRVKASIVHGDVLLR